MLKRINAVELREAEQALRESIQDFCDADPQEMGMSQMEKNEWLWSALIGLARIHSEQDARS